MALNGIRYPQALRITAIYLVFGVLWLVLTEILLVDLIRDTVWLESYQRYKSWVFVLITALLIHDLIRRAEAAMRESEQRFTATFEQAAVGIGHDDTDGQWLRVNQRLCEMLGYSRAELLRLRFQDITHPDDIATDLDHMRRMIAGEIESYSLEKRYVHKSGDIVWVNLTVSLVWKRPGVPDYFIAVAEDITQRRRTEQALRQSERQQAAILDSVPDIAWLKDRNSRFLAVNKPFVEMVGVASPNEIIGKSEFDICPPELAALYYADDQVVLHTKRAKHTEEPGRDAHGRGIWLETIKVPVFDDTGRVVGTAGISRDATERRQTRLVQQVRNEALDRIVANQPLAVTLDGIARGLESIRPNGRVSIRVLDPQSGYLIQTAAPSLPAFYVQALKHLVPGPAVGTCGTAAHTGEPVVVEDVFQHPNWVQHRELARRAGFTACWSVPFKNDTGRVLGTFAVHHAETRRPEPDDFALIDEFARLAGLAVERARTEAALRQSAAVFENTHEGAFITTLDPRIIAVNQACTDITGYAENDLLDSNPSLLRSGRHEPGFYSKLWAELLETGHWQGEIWNRRKNGEIYPQWLTISTVYDDQGDPSHYVGVFTDITRIKESEARLERLAHYDPLTQLPNRLLVQYRLEHALERARRQDHKVAVIFLDLNDFKQVNDILGHPIGDELLVALARRLSQRIRGEDTFARLGGDEFLVILEQLQCTEDVAGVARTLIGLLETPFTLSSGHQLSVGASIGISLYPENGKDPETLIRNADSAMYQVKSRDQNAFHFSTQAVS